jgi:hypothetical protein
LIGFPANRSSSILGGDLVSGEQQLDFIQEASG